MSLSIDEKTGRAEDGAERLRVLGQLASGVAHEINNWFFVIRGFSELARLDLADDDPMTENLDRIEEAVDAAELLTRMMLECSHPSGDGVVATPLHPLVKEAVKLRQPELSDGAAVQQSVSTETAPVMGSPVVLFAALTALLRWVSAPIVDDAGLLWVHLSSADGESAASQHAVLLAMGGARGDRVEELKSRLQGLDPAAPVVPVDRGAPMEAVEAITRDTGAEVVCRAVDDDGRSVEIVIPLGAGAAFR